MKVLSTALFLVLFTAGVWGVWYLQTSLPVLKTIEPFQMTSVLDGGRYSSDNDRIKVVAFFYTECPDICPFTISDLKEVYEALETEGAFDEKKMEFVSITLDPEADTDERIRRYADSFDADIKGWHWLRGTEAETADLTEEFRMRRMKVEGEIVHSTTLYLMDADHQIRGTYAMATYRDRLNREELMDDVLKLIDQ